jgi:hypothetical protein
MERSWGLTRPQSGIKYPHFRQERAPGAKPGFMNSNQPLASPNLSTTSNPMTQPCRHPRVQIVSRDEDAEFVECLECREVFESSEFKDMAIEERVNPDTDA